MPTGIYIRTKQHRKILSEAQKRIGNKPPVFSGNKSSNWKGGKIFRSGYIFVKKPEHPFSGKQGYIAEHRLIMEKYLERYLTKKEVVHHINGIKTDNRIENLKLYSSPGQHTRIEHSDIFKNQKVKFKNKHFFKETEFKKGRIPWNKGRKNIR